MPPRARVKEQDRTLLDIPVVDDVAPVIDDDRYADAALDVDRFRFAALDVDRFRFAAAGADRAPAVPDADRFTAAAGWGRHADRSRYTARPGRKLVRRTILVLPPHRTQGELLWIPAGEYERRLEDWGEDIVWQLGSVIDFSYALESLKWQGGYDDEEDAVQICMTVIDDEAETWEPDRHIECCYGEQPRELMEHALAIRAEIAQRPDLVVEVLEIGDLMQIGTVAGMTRIPVQMEVADAIANAPESGLGGAALDHAVWRMASLFGPPGARFAEELENRMEDEDEGPLRLNPTENFLLYSGSLPPGAAPVPVPPHMRNQRLYAMTGGYVVSKASYVSDLSGAVIGGWRSCWLEPLPKQPPEVYPERS